MAKTLLLGPDLDLGKRFIELLDAAEFPVTVACWLRCEEQFGEAWELVLGSQLYDTLGPKQAYRRLIDALPPIKASEFQIRLLGNRHPLVKGLRKAFGKAGSVEEMRLGGQGFGGVWIDDGYAYRIT